jgi:hypothetical protein
MTSQQKIIPFFKWFTEHPDLRPPMRAVFDPRRQSGPLEGTNEFNLWNGFGVRPEPIHDEKLDVILRHIRDIICSGDKKKWKYLMRYLAWTVQNPERPAEVAVVFQTLFEGAGKNALGDLMVKIFGRHGRICGNRESLIGTHATNELICFMLLDGALFHGDKQTADMLKSIITGGMRTINPKYQAERDIVNRLTIFIFSNHEFVVPARYGARRFVIYSVSEARAFTNDLAKRRENIEYFKRYEWAVTNGGAGQFLHYLLTSKLPDGWHPRQIIRTEELAEHQRASMPSTYKWLLACVEEGKLVGSSRVTSYNLTITTITTIPELPLNALIATSQLYDAYRNWTNQQPRREAVETYEMFGRHMSRILGLHRRLAAGEICMPLDAAGNPVAKTNKPTNSKRPWGYIIPDEATIDSQVNRAYGIILE